MQTRRPPFNLSSSSNPYIPTVTGSDHRDLYTYLVSNFKDLFPVIAGWLRYRLIIEKRQSTASMFWQMCILYNYAVFHTPCYVFRYSVSEQILLTWYTVKSVVDDRTLFSMSSAILYLSYWRERISRHLPCIHTPLLFQFPGSSHLTYLSSFLPCPVGGRGHEKSRTSGIIVSESSYSAVYRKDEAIKRLGVGIRYTSLEGEHYKTVSVTPGARDCIY